MKAPRIIISTLKKTGIILSCILLGTLTAVALIEIGLALFGHTYMSLFEAKQQTVMPSDKSQITIACFGESMTMQVYPEPLQERLSRLFPDTEFSIIDKGLSCTDSEYVASIIDETLDTHNPDIVIVMTGINDTRDKDLYGHNTIRLPWYKRLHTYRLYRFLKNDFIRRQTQDKVKDLVKDRGEQQPEHSQAKEPGNSLDEQTFEIRHKQLTDKIQSGQAVPSDFEELINLLKDNQSFVEAEKTFYMARERFPEVFNTILYHEYICRTIISQQNLENILSFTINFLKSPIADTKDPKMLWAYDLMITTYWDLDRFQTAEQVLLNARDNDENLRESLTHLLTQTYMRQKKYNKAEALLKEHIPQNDFLIPILLYLYIETENYEKVDELLKSNVIPSATPEEKNWILRSMALNLLNQGKVKEAEKVFDIVNRDSLNNIPQSTITNYRHIAKAVIEQKKVLVCMQYPMRKLSVLKKTLSPYEKHILFIDNEKSFKDAVLNLGCKNIFEDIFGGDFGHLRQPGLKLILDNIIRTLRAGPLKDLKIKSE